MTDAADNDLPLLPKIARPFMPPAYGLEASSAGLLPWSWAADRLLEARNYWICTVTSAGRPHAAPVWGVWYLHTLYFSTDPESLKGRNLLRRGRVVVHLESGDEVVILHGETRYFADAREIHGLAECYLEKYGIDVTAMPAESVAWFALRLESAEGWREADFQASATHWGFK